MITIHRHAGTCTLTLARPDRANALTADLVEALLAETTRACADAAVHTLVLAAEGRHFCTGLDLSDLESQSDAELLHRLVRIETLLSLLWHAPIRSVALAQGRAWGAGADLFAACEHRLVAEDTTLRFPGAQFGVVLGTRRLAQRVGSDAARGWVLNGTELDATQALGCGLASGRRAALPAEPDWPAPAVGAGTARAIRAVTQADHRDADLAALVRSAAEPGLKNRIRAYREQMARAVRPTDA